ncbi:MAG: energy transducer TonB [Fibrobacteria bacterium]|nr:energy transducer TonB [Fibrobacteria bacterium]
MTDQAQNSQSIKSKTDKEFQKKFETDSDKRLMQFFAACLCICLGLGFYFTIMEIIVPEIVKAITEDIQATAKFEDVDKKKKKEEKKEKVKKPSKKRGGGGRKRGRGNPKDVSGVGVLKMLTSRSKSSSHRAYDLMSSKFNDIEKSLNKIAGLTTTGKTRLSGRKGKLDAGFNDGFATGGTGGIDDMLGGLLGGSDMGVGVEAKGKLRPPNASEIDMGQGGSRRSAASILRVIRQHMPGLRHTYNKHLKKNPGFSGKIHIKFLIAPSGKTVSVSIVGSTTGVSSFDSEIKNKVRRWRFEPITGKGNDVVTIPFSFSE